MLTVKKQTLYKSLKKFTYVETFKNKRLLVQFLYFLKLA
jgi:hypothetical protein